MSDDKPIEADEINEPTTNDGPDYKISVDVVQKGRSACIRPAKKYEYKGRCETISDWKKLFASNVPSGVINGRLNRGWEFERCFKEPIKAGNPFATGRQSPAHDLFNRILDIYCQDPKRLEEEVRKAQDRDYWYLLEKFGLQVYRTDSQYGHSRDDNETSISTQISIQNPKMNFETLPKNQPVIQIKTE